MPHHQNHQQLRPERIQKQKHSPHSKRELIKAHKGRRVLQPIKLAMMPRRKKERSSQKTHRHQIWQGGRERRRGTEPTEGVEGTAEAKEAPGGEGPEDEEKGGGEGESSDIQTKIRIAAAAAAAAPNTAAAAAAAEKEEGEEGGEVEEAGYSEVEGVGGPQRKVLSVDLREPVEEEEDVGEGEEDGAF